MLVMTERARVKPDDHLKIINSKRLAFPLVALASAARPPMHVRLPPGRAYSLPRMRRFERLRMRQFEHAHQAV
jgi:hypothetical protein